MQKVDQEAIVQLKEIYNSIYLVDTRQFVVDNLAFSHMVIRPLTRREFNLIGDQEDKVVSKCLVYPPNLEHEYLAGLDSYIFKAVLKISGFNTQEQLIIGINNGRSQAATLESCITLFICKAFPSISPIDVDNMDFEEIAKYASMAELSLGKEIPYDQFLNPEKYKKKKKISKDDGRERLIARRQAINNLPQPKHEEVYQAPEPTEEVIITKNNFLEEQKKLMGIINGR